MTLPPAPQGSKAKVPTSNALQVCPARTQRPAQTTRKHANIAQCSSDICLAGHPESTSNVVAVGTFDPGVEIWDLDRVDAVEPVAVLGGVAGTSGDAAGGDEGEKKKKKKKKVSRLCTGERNDHCVRQ